MGLMASPTCGLLSPRCRLRTPTAAAASRRRRSTGVSLPRAPLVLPLWCPRASSTTPSSSKCLTLELTTLTSIFRIEIWRKERTHPDRVLDPSFSDHGVAAVLHVSLDPSKAFGF